MAPAFPGRGFNYSRPQTAEPIVAICGPLPKTEAGKRALAELVKACASFALETGHAERYCSCGGLFIGHIARTGDLSRELLDWQFLHNGPGHQLVPVAVWRCIRREYAHEGGRACSPAC